MSTRRRLPQKLGQPMVKPSAKVLGKASIDESKTTVFGGGDAIKPKTHKPQDVVDISSDSSSEEESDDDDDSADEESAAEEDVPMEDAEPAPDALSPDEAEETGDPSFGDLVRANASEPIDVAGAFEDFKTQAVPHPKPQIQTPSGASLGTVLSQALRTNDVSLLESCLHTSDKNIIRATIARLESPLAGKLIARLAERLHKRPGRAGSMMVWTQWTLVSHGGYLATQPDLIKKLAALNQVIDARSRGLQSVLALKGKLDMLESQIELRRTVQNQSRRLDEDDEEGIIYVEGQETEERAESAKVHRSAGVNDLEINSDGESGVSEDMPLINGVIADSDEEEDSSEDDLIDDEAEETDNDSEDEDEVDHDDQDSMDEDDESDDGIQAAPPTKIARTGGQFSKKG